MPACPSNHTHAQAPVKRRLAAIAFADVVGYSILMARDETRTHAQWMSMLADIVRPQVERHHGTIVKLIGDGVLVEFPSAFDAVDWARNVQHSVVSAGRDQSAANPAIVLRVAVHVGDIIDQDNDIYGDGINVAARLQEHAPPGGVVMSEAVYGLVGGSLDIQARDLGFLELKNIEKPVRAYVIDTGVPDVSLPFRSEREKLPSIAILPLQNVGGNSADDYFSDGVVEDITLSLAGLRELMVISRGSSLAYRGQQPDPRAAGRALGVRYVTTGTVRRFAQSVRVSVELCETSTGASLWNERTECAPGELFDVQDRIVARIVAGIAPNVRAAELRAAMRKRPENFTAYDYTLRALHVFHSLDVNTFRQAREFLERAMAEDPNFATPFAWAARWYGLYVGQGWSSSPYEDRAKAVELAAKAIELDGQNALALATYGHLKSFLFHDYDSALTYFDRALAACPNHSLAWLLSSPTLSYIGRAEQAIRHAEQALRLSPLDRSLFYYFDILSLAHYAAGNYEEAVKWGRMGANENPRHAAHLRYLAASYAAVDRLDEAQDAARGLMAMHPDFRLSVFERTLQPFRDPPIKERYLDHLRKAGLPE
jgi:adenylate cyclase